MQSLHQITVSFKKGMAILLLFLFAQFSHAQLLDSIALTKVTEYTNLDSALKDPDKVIKLVLRKKHLKEFPQEILKFKNLQYLDLSKNNIKEIPDGIGQMVNLQYFMCSKTGLEKLSKEIGKLKYLRYININQNEVESLPWEFGQLEKLEIADMWSNNLSEFPESLNKLTSLKVLDLRNILISDDVQKTVQEMLPKTKIYFSPSCKCKS